MQGNSYVSYNSNDTMKFWLLYNLMFYKYVNYRLLTSKIVVYHYPFVISRFFLVNASFIPQLANISAGAVWKYMLLALLRLLILTIFGSIFFYWGRFLLLVTMTLFVIDLADDSLWWSMDFMEQTLRSYSGWEL